MGSRSNPLKIKLDSAKHAQAKKHIADAKKAGHPDKLTVDRPGQHDRRKDSLRGHPRVPGKDRDEYPPAIAKEGGKNASVRPIDPSDNKGAGALMSAKLRKYPDGTTFTMD